MRSTGQALALILLLSGTSTAVSAQAYGFTTEPFVPVGKFSNAADVGWGITGWVGTRLGGKKSKWVIEGNVGAQWHAGDRIDEDEFPGLVLPDTVGDDDAVDFATWLFPVRASLTRLFGRAYVSPRVGVFIPAGDLKSKLNFGPSFGISPKAGYFFFIARELTADLGLEYTAVFGDETLMYVGFSVGFLHGGRRLPRRPIPY